MIRINRIMHNLILFIDLIVSHHPYHLSSLLVFAGW
ncbi:hypothetical protein Newbould305_1000 [Staphylococcus aureus subsp. aureus str. Newbould 305]|nr:hypothetical protein Newbould305_1000 [Staphylococcus aureus subsp. aureus str. Newbould 305]